jgi:hypothetical protein
VRARIDMRCTHAVGYACIRAHAHVHLCESVRLSLRYMVHCGGRRANGERRCAPASSYAGVCHCGSHTSVFRCSTAVIRRRTLNLNSAARRSLSAMSRAQFLVKRDHKEACCSERDKRQQ